jgi:hypothetical protein
MLTILHSFLFILHPRSWFTPKVWVNPLLLGWAKGDYLHIGQVVSDGRGRLCTVTKQGTIGGIKRLSVRKSKKTIMGKALAGHRSLRYYIMSMKFLFLIYRYRAKRWGKNLFRLNRNNIIFWFLLLSPAALASYIAYVEMNR